MFSISCMLGTFCHMSNPYNLRKSLHGHTQDLLKRQAYYSFEQWINYNTPLNRILEKPKLTQRRNFPPFMEDNIYFRDCMMSPLALFRCQMNPGHTFPLFFLRSMLIFFSHLCVDFSIFLFPLGFPNKTDAG